MKKNKPNQNIVTAGHSLTVQAAQIALEAGGNAFDAAVAAIFASFITEPCMSSPAGGGFINAFQANGENLIFDFFCQTPSQKIGQARDFHPVELFFGSASEQFYVGQASVAVPGTTAGVFHLWKKLGSIPLKYLVEPAIHYAREGILVDQFQAMDFGILQPIMTRHPRGLELFYDQKGQPLKKGAILRMEYLADFLDSLCKEGEGLFYRGEISRMIDHQMKESGGWLRREDLENYKVIERQPECLSYRGLQISTNPLPSLGGSLLLLGLEQLLSDPPSEKDFYSRLSQMLLSMDQMSRDPDELRRLLDEHIPKIGGTTHFNIVDRKGNGVSCSLSNGEGNGHFLAGTDIQLNNMLGEPALMPEGPHSWIPDRRVSSMMSPSLIINGKGELAALLGTGGAGRIPAMISQVIAQLLLRDKSIAEAVEAARIYVHEGILHMERETPDFNYPPQLQLNRWKEMSLFFGGVHTIGTDGKRWEGVGDKRRFGVCHSFD